jgi:hypothetical protein
MEEVEKREKEEDGEKKKFGAFFPFRAGEKAFE